MKYQQIDAKRMNEYLGYMITCLQIYRNGNDVPEYAYQQYKKYIEELQQLNSEMSKI